MSQLWPSIAILDGCEAQRCAAFSYTSSGNCTAEFEAPAGTIVTDLLIEAAGSLRIHNEASPRGLSHLSTV